MKEIKEGYKELEMYCGNIDTCIKELHNKDYNGEKYYMKFNGATLYSDTVTMDSAYLAVLGMTRAEYEAKNKFDAEEYNKKEEEFKNSIPHLLKNM